jgi:hypothetical protein
MIPVQTIPGMGVGGIKEGGGVWRIMYDIFDTL